MRRIAVIIGIVIGVVATPTMVAASGSNSQSRSNADKYDLAHTWNTPLGQLYGPVKVGPSSYGFISK